MSVEKYVVTRESAPFTTILNKVINGLKGDLELLGFYLYLLSLPPEWSFYKETLKETCGIGVKKLERFLRLLAQCNLIEVAQMRNEKGHFAQFDLKVRNGEDFKIIDLGNAQPCVKNRTAVNGRTDMRGYKRNNKEIKEKEIKHSCANDFALEWKNWFEKFWNLYPKKKDKKRAMEIFKKLSPEIFPLILEKLARQIKEDAQWQNKQYIPNPSTYLNGERWHDEIMGVQAKVIPLKTELTSTVLEYGVGHPTWEANQEWKRKHAAQGSDDRRDSIGRKIVS